MGGKSGGGGHTPYEAPDSLKSAQRLNAIGLISLGPIKGAVTDDKYQSVYFDHTPLKNARGEWNYLNTEIQYNLGTQDQLPLTGFEASEREVAVNAEVKKEHSLSRTVIDHDVTRVRVTIGVGALFHQHDNGDTHGSSVQFEILVNNQRYHLYTIEGKSSSRFFRSYMVENLPPRPFTLTVRRITDDSTSQRLQNSTHWASYTEIIDTKLSYPNMAVVGIRTDSRYNPNFPNINFLLYGRLVKIPANYDPIARTYGKGLWKGDWKLDWTNNPAWVFYDLVTNKLAGLGQRLGDYGIDKFQLYQIAQYCDQPVPGGYGGQEPRMTANLWITEQRDAYSVVSDMASVFRAIVVWNGTQLTAIQDRPADPVCRYTQANVIEGKFNRQYVPLKSIYTAVEVEYADEKNQYQKAIEYVADDALIRRYGYNVKKIVAFACTSRGQARRYGKWVLETSRLEQCTMTFSVGREGLQTLPGDIIEIADKTYANLNLGGRVLAVDGRTVTLDSPVELSGESYLCYSVDQATVRRRITRAAGAVVTLQEEAQGLTPMSIWTLQTPLLSTERYRVLSVAEDDDGNYTITALQHEPQKEAIVDNGAAFESLATTRQGGLQAVQNAEISANGRGVLLTFQSPHFVGQGLKYRVTLYRNGRFYQLYDDLTEPNLAFNDLPDGEYIAEIRAKNGAGQLSEPVTQSFTLSLTIRELTTVSQIFGIELQWQNPLTAPPNSSIELWVADCPDFGSARKLVSLAYPTNRYFYGGLGMGDRYYFWARMTNGERAGEFTEVAEGTPEQSATAITGYLNGQITEAHLGKSLIDSLQSDIDEAVSEEAKTRQAAVANIGAQILAEARERTKAMAEETRTRIAAITAEANNRTKALQAEAQARGTAITALQNVDREQAKLITAATAKADNALSGLADERTARANADSAEAQARSALASRVASAESGITALQRSVASQASALTEASQTLAAKIDGLGVGGRNYVLNSDTATSNWKSVQLSPSFISSIRGKTIVISFDVNFAQLTKTGNDRIGFEFSITYSDGRTDWSNAWIANASSRYPNGFNGRVHFVHQVRDLEITRIDNVGIYNQTSDRNATIAKPKLEIGTIPTDWVPAPEDLNQSIANLQANLTTYQSAQATKEQVTAQKLTQLESGLGSKANTSALNNYYTKAQADNAVSQQVNNLKAVMNTELGKKVSADKVAADLIAERTARTSADSALGQRIDTVTASINNTKAQVSQISNAVAEANGKLSATHSLKTEVIAGGRRAIAGIALGAAADGQTLESSVIVMADKFGVVKNATDSNITPMFTVIENRVAVSGDLIARGSITGDKIQANTQISAPIVQGGTIRSARLESAHIEAATINGGHISGTTIDGGIIRGARFIGATGDFTGTLVVSSTLGAIVGEYGGHLHYQHIGTVQTSSESCYDDSNNGRYTICSGRNEWRHEFKASLSLWIPASHEETVVLPPLKGNIVSTNPHMNSVLGGEGRVALAGVGYTVVIEDYLTAHTNYHSHHKAAEWITLKRHKRF